MRSGAISLFHWPNNMGVRFIVVLNFMVDSPSSPEVILARCTSHIMSESHTTQAILALKITSVPGTDIYIQRKR